MAEDNQTDSATVTYTPEICEVKPLEVYMSTDLNNKNRTYDDIAERILHFFGYPSVAVSDLHRNQIYDAISIAVERFTRWAGTTRQYLILDSRLYQRNKGIAIDKLCTISGLMERPTDYSTTRSLERGPQQQIHVPQDVYITKTYVKKSDYYINDSDYELLSRNVSGEDLQQIKMLLAISKKYPDGIEQLSIISEKFFEFLTKKRNYHYQLFKKSKDQVFTIGGEKQQLYNQTEHQRKRESLQYNKMFDYDIMDYRKVSQVVGYNESGVSSITSLYNFDTSLAQQFFYTNQFNHRSFGLVSWYALHQWRNTYQKLLATKRGYRFNKDTQYLTLTPQPKQGERFFGIVECWVERPLKDVLKEPWVFDYALALTKQMLGRVRSKWQGVSYLGGGSLSGNSLAQQGIQKQKQLMDQLMHNQAYGAQGRPRFKIG